MKSLVFSNPQEASNFTKSNEGSSVVTKATEIIEGSSSILDKIIDAELEVHKHVQDSQIDNLHGIKEIATNLTNLVDRSKAENQELETIIYSI